VSRGDNDDESADRPAMSMLASAQTDAHDQGAASRLLLRHGVSVAEELGDVAERESADLVIIGAYPRNLDGRVFLGHTIEEVLATCDATVVVVTIPPDDAPASSSGSAG
jgi:nucleotide-binding universal stress UspA family protein